jgi:hypothetical protein
MRKWFFLTALISCVFCSFAQWNTNGSNIYYSNGNVEIGTTSPKAVLDVRC